MSKLGEVTERLIAGWLQWRGEGQSFENFVRESAAINENPDAVEWIRYADLMLIAKDDIIPDSMRTKAEMENE